jgi:hypothetical protein
MGGHHLVYDPQRPAIGPTRWFGGHTGERRGRPACPLPFRPPHAAACTLSRSMLEA